MRVWLPRSCGASADKAVKQALLLAGLLAVVGGSASADLIIVPTFHSSITSDANSAGIISTINTAISWYQSTFSDNVTVNITFKASTSGLGSTEFPLYLLSYEDYYNALVLDGTSVDDAAALLRLAVDGAGVNNPVTGNTDILIKGPNARALGFSTPGGTDATISLNTSLTTPGSPSSSGVYYLLPVVYHEINEALGLGSTLGLPLPGALANTPSPQDLFRFDGSGNRSFTTSGTAASYFSIDGAAMLAQFNQASSGDYGDWATTATKRVQDAFATPGANPLPNVEIRALDAIGYDVAPVPEPGTVALVLAGVVTIALRRRLVV